MIKTIIKADNDDVNWINSFNAYCDGVFIIGQEIDQEDVERFQKKADDFNNRIACGLAISLEEVE